MTSPRPRATGRHDVLIANSRSDEAWAAWATGVLRDAGRSVALLQDGLREFLDVRQVIERELRSAGQLVVLLSRPGAGFLTEVVSVANGLGKRVVPVHLDAAAVPYPRTLAHLRAVDLTGVPLDTAAERLLSAVAGSFDDRVRPNHRRRRPPAPDPFVGRESELRRLHDAFFAGGPAVVVSGRTGVGTSALAAQFVRRNRGHWANALWTSPARFADDQLRLLTRPHRPALLVVDGVEDYRAVRDAMWPVLLDRDLVNVLVTSSSTDWPEPFRVVEVGPLDRASATRLVTRALPGISPADAAWVAEAVGDSPAAVESLARLVEGAPVADLVAELSGLLEVARSVGAEEHGFYYLESRDPAEVSAFERAFVALGEIELLSAGRSPWRRWWRRRCASELRVPAVVRLMAAALPLTRIVFTVGSTVFVKSPELGPRFVTRTLSTPELRDFEQSQRLREDPVAEVLGGKGVRA